MFNDQKKNAISLGKFADLNFSDSIDMPDDDGFTPLQRALQGIRPNIPKDERESPNFKHIENLISKGADCMRPDPNGHSPIRIIQFEGTERRKITALDNSNNDGTEWERIFELMIDFHNIKQCPDTNPNEVFEKIDFSSLRRAVGEANLEETRTLLAAVPAHHARFVWNYIKPRGYQGGFTLFMDAVRACSKLSTKEIEDSDKILPPCIQMVKLALEYGADPNIRHFLDCNMGLHPLGSAVLDGNPTLVKILLDAGASTSARFCKYHLSSAQMNTFAFVGEDRYLRDDRESKLRTKVLEVFQAYEDNSLIEWNSRWHMEKNNLDGYLDKENINPDLYSDHASKKICNDYRAVFKQCYEAATKRKENQRVGSSSVKNVKPHLPIINNYQTSPDEPITSDNLFDVPPPYTKVDPNGPSSSDINKIPAPINSLLNHNEELLKAFQESRESIWKQLLQHPTEARLQATKNILKDMKGKLAKQNQPARDLSSHSEKNASGSRNNDSQPNHQNNSSFFAYTATAPIPTPPAETLNSSKLESLFQNNNIAQCFKKYGITDYPSLAAQIRFHDDTEISHFVQNMEKASQSKSVLSVCGYLKWKGLTEDQSKVLSKLVKYDENITSYVQKSSGAAGKKRTTQQTDSKDLLKKLLQDPYQDIILELAKCCGFNDQDKTLKDFSLFSKAVLSILEHPKACTSLLKHTHPKKHFKIKITEHLDAQRPHTSDHVTRKHRRSAP